MTQANLIQEQARCIAHEIRNHISICDVYTEIIKKNLLNAGVDLPSVNNALNCIGRSLKIMSNSLIDLKSLDNYKIKKCDLRELLFQSVEMSKVYVQDKCVQFSLDVAENILVEVDENKFTACVVNLIKNAIESILEEGFVKILVESVDSKAIIRFINNGQKIPDEKQIQIFEEGFTTKKTGSGLGLYICKNNLKAQNSELRLIKSDDTSTEFEIEIPTA